MLEKQIQGWYSIKVNFNIQVTVSNLCSQSHKAPAVCISSPNFTSTTVKLNNVAPFPPSVWIKPNYSEDGCWQVAPLLAFGDRVDGTQAGQRTRGTNFLFAPGPNLITSRAHLMFEIIWGQIFTKWKWTIASSAHQTQTDLFQLMLRDTEAEVYEL